MPKLNKAKHKKEIKVVVSGGFDPLHVGHVEMFKLAKAFGNKLIVILNNDNWLKKKKGYVFMKQQERKKIIEAIRYVDRVVVSGHKPNPSDMSVCAELKKVKPDIFCQGGDRNVANIPPCEVKLQKKLGYRVIDNVGKKIQSSSDLVNKHRSIKQVNANCKKTNR
jgi:D-beta-D-heptose 7-phosphate kinase/D-beta-D-heptose 1-phosphate adenosyltransferase